MTLIALPRARALAPNPVFADACAALQRVVFDEQPSSWEAAPAVAAVHAGNRVWRALGGHTRPDHYAARLARSLGLLLQALDAPHWTVLPLHPRAGWCTRRGGRAVHPALARARVAVALRPGFRGALQFDAEGARVAVPLWFWSSRCGVVAGELQACAGSLPLTATLCAHGNVHLQVYEPGLLQRLDGLAADCGMAPIEGFVCRELFGRANRPGTGIAGRGLVV